MAEKEAQSGSKDAEVASEASAGKQPGPEIDQEGAARLVQKSAQMWLLDNLDAIMKRVADGAKAGDSGCLKMLFEWVFKLPAAGNLAELPPSFAAELWEISKKLLAETEE